MLSEHFSLDHIDRKIVEIIQEQPNLTHTKIAKKVNRSQPTVGMRIKKLEEAGILEYQAGLNLKKVDIQLAKVTFQTENEEKISSIIQQCPNLIHAYKVSGEDNFLVVAGCESFKDLDKVVNYHFRSDPEVRNVRMEIFSDIINEFVLRVEFGTKDCACFKKNK
ncbi:MAG: Lrp/AsnC family transcriptional regulator [Promethearchaeota archaeon]|nr:MAG: Lrp/AsnC family transcriptional regulator [Candidatus Lokiarchaeota archaeon]